MNKDRQTEAKSIGDILSRAYLQQQSGLLNLEYSQTGHTEKGNLYILAGQPMYARVGRLSGQEALERMLRWQNIRFSFIADAPRPPANLSSKVRIAAPAVPITPTNHTNTLPVPYPQYSQPRSLPTPGEKRVSGAIGSGGGEGGGRGSEWLVPQKIASEQYALSLSLTHRQRLIYFLVNGQRTIGDLARTSGKTIVEVEMTVSELQKIGLIVLSESH
jgi:hypothetical protein